MEVGRAHLKIFFKNLMIKPSMDQYLINMVQICQTKNWTSIEQFSFYSIEIPRSSYKYLAVLKFFRNNASTTDS